MNYWTVNTNKSNFDVKDYLIKNERASVFYKGWKEKVDKLKIADIVFLYENGVGVVACGIVSSERKIKDIDLDVLKLKAGMKLKKKKIDQDEYDAIVNLKDLLDSNIPEDDYKDQEYYVDLDNFHVLPDAISHKEAESICEKIPVRQVVNSLNENNGEKLKNHIASKYAWKC